MSVSACESNHPDYVRRKAMKVAVAALVSEAGFSHAEDAVLETLTEMLQSYLCELGRSCRALAELSSRTEPMLSDVVMSLIEMGEINGGHLGNILSLVAGTLCESSDVQALPAYAKRPSKMVFMPPGPGVPTSNPRTLQAGQKKSHPSYIPEYLPSFPDPHTYIRTATYKKPISEYQLLREKAASQKRDVERALTRFIAKTGETENLFPDDPYAFPLIACQPKEIPYLEALIPKDFDLDSDESHTEQLQQQQKQQENQAEKEDASKTADASKPAAANTEAQEGSVPVGEPQTPTKQNPDGGEAADDSQIDNPYLRPIKMPRLKGGKSKSKY